MVVAPASQIECGGADRPRVLVLTPADGDAEAVVGVLGAAGHLAAACPDLACVASEIGRDGGRGVGTVIIAQEALLQAGPAEHSAMAAALGAQPEWSDLPLILLAVGNGQGDRAWEFAQALEPLGSIAILERPLRRATLLNAVAVALRVRARQYELRGTLEELAQHREHLQQLVSEKAAQLAESTASLHASERLASLGTLAAGLGHDLANLTLPIRARLDALRESVAPGEALDDLNAIGKAIAHLSQLSAGMRLMALDPSREAASAPADDLCVWAEETVPMLRAALPRHVRFIHSIAPGLGVRMPRHLLAQAVFNLVQNAGEAMQGLEAGTIRLEAEPVSADDPTSDVRMVVSDDGPGMPPEVRARCFEPYFSTKARAIATGMGLAMVKGIIEGAGGAISVESEEAQGTTFCLTLPRAAPPAEDAPAEGPRCAISVSDPRIARLVRLFLGELRIAPVEHAGRSIPPAEIWVCDTGDADQVARFLDLGSDRRAVVLVAPGPDGAGRLDVVRTRHAHRVTVVADRPSAGVLRRAIAAACGVATAPAPGW